MTLSPEQVLQRSGAMPPDDDEEDEIGELEIAEYVVFILALDTYSRYLEEATGSKVDDDLVRKGVQLVKMADRAHVGTIKEFLGDAMPTGSQKKMMDKAFRFLPSNSTSLGRRRMQMQFALERGGPATLRKIFKSNKAIREMKAAMAAADIEDADVALDKFAVIPLKNMRLRRWIDMAAEAAGSGSFQNAVAVGSEEADEDVAAIATARTNQQGTSPDSEEHNQAVSEKDDRLLDVQEKATEAAERAMVVSGEVDEPPAKSEVVGIATAAAVAVTTDPANPNNVPAPLRKLDDEQRMAALTDGRVLVAAGAGAGKSTTVVSRTEFLVKDRRVDPSRILVTSFNKKAADELEQKIGTAIGGDSVSQMSVGTMHKLFKKFIGEYGTGRERMAMGLAKGRSGFVKGGSPVARAVQRMWSDCYPADTPEERKVPRLKNVLLAKAKWAGNNITPAKAKEEARTPEEVDAADWYEMYEGLKGAIPGWTAPCKSKAYERFMGRWRPNDQRLGDFDDMLVIFDNILKREPAVRKTLQQAFDHVIVDEAQDLSGVQYSVISQMTEHVSDGKDGKSLWICGDDKQSIYGFRGARPDLFTSLSETEGWTTKMIRTNYRCQPEIVEAANALIAHNEKQIPMEAVPSPHKARGMASIEVRNPPDEATAALSVVEEIKSDITADGNVTDNAILTRTNKEQHAYETACIIRGVPYARKGTSSFLGSPETKAFLGYVDLVMGSDFGKMQKALAEVLNKPNRFFVAPEVCEQAVNDSLYGYAKRMELDVKTVNPIAAMEDDMFMRSLAGKLARSKSGFKFRKTIEKLEELRGEMGQMKARSEDPEYTTTDLFEDILGMRGTATVTDSVTGRTEYVEQTFRESLKADLRDAIGDDEDAAADAGDDEEGSETEGLGNVSFLFELIKKDPTDPEDMITDPGTPFGFKAKMDRYAAKADELRVDVKKWEDAQKNLPPEERKPPPGVYLGTVHSVKGAQWKNCYVAMPKGRFPIVPPAKPGEPPPDPAVQQEELESERRLAYVALSRAAENLNVICPNVVGGKAAGISPFVSEAGLAVGQNVPKPETEAEVEVGEEVIEEEPEVRTAAVEYEGVLPDDWEEE